METVFLKILNMSITAGWLVLAVLLMRLLLKKAPRYLTVIMWALVGIRLVLPFSLESALSLIPCTETVPTDILLDRTPQIQTGIDVLNSAVNPVISESFAPDPGASVNPLQVLTWLAGWLWLVGMVGMAVYALVSYLRIRRKIREATPVRENIWICDRIDTPFILGLFRPRIYLPSAMAAQDMPYVIAHEQAHLKRKDHLWKPLGFALLTIHWFNPLLWVAYILLCRDIEVACDEKVLKDMGDTAKKPYSLALINCSVPRRTVAACPLAFGEVSVKSRIKSVLNYKKPAFWLLVVAIVVCIVLSVCFLTNPKTVNAQMQVFLDCQIASHFQSEHSAGNACCVDYEILGTKKNGSATTVYMWVLYEEYSYENGQLQQETGSHIPTVITAAKVDGSYVLVEYWEPRDGIYNPVDIKAKFPWYLRLKALDSQRYIDRQKAHCLEIAEKYFEENPPSLSDPSTDQEALKNEPGEKLREYELLELRKEYPEYFDLPTDNGLAVYVWQMAAGAYSWGLLPKNSEGTSWTDWTDWMTLKSASLEEIRAIVDSYGLDRSMVTICPIQMPHSSYAYTIDDAYLKKVETMFWYTTYTYDIVPGGTAVRELFDVTVSYAGGTDPEVMKSGALNRDEVTINNSRHFPIFRLDSEEDLEQFIYNYIGIFHSEAGWDEVPYFTATLSQYDDAFFSENTLLLVYVHCSNCTHRFDVSHIYHDDTSLCVYIEETTCAKVVDDAEAAWLIAIAIPDSMAADCTEFDATLAAFTS